MNRFVNGAKRTAMPTTPPEVIDFSKCDSNLTCQREVHCVPRATIEKIQAEDPGHVVTTSPQWAMTVLTANPDCQEPALLRETLRRQVETWLAIQQLAGRRLTPDDQEKLRILGVDPNDGGLGNAVTSPE